MSNNVCYNNATVKYGKDVKQNHIAIGYAYELKNESIMGNRESYTLNKLNEEFFYRSKIDVTIAISHSVPVIGKPMVCLKLQFVNYTPKFIGCYTSPVKSILRMGDNVYKVATNEGIYIVAVG